MKKYFLISLMGFMMTLSINYSTVRADGDEDCMVSGAARMGYELITTKMDLEKRYGIKIVFRKFDTDSSDHIHALMDELQNFSTALIRLQASVNNGLSEVKLQFKTMVIESTYATTAVEYDENEKTVFIYVDHDYVSFGLSSGFYDIVPRSQNRTFDLVDQNMIIDRLFRDLELVQVTPLRERTVEEITFDKNKNVRINVLKKRIQELEEVKFDTRFNYDERLKKLLSVYENRLETVAVILVKIPQQNNAVKQVTPQENQDAPPVIPDVESTEAKSKQPK